MKTITKILLLLLVITTYSTHAQKQGRQLTDSLLRELNTGHYKEDTNKVKLLDALAASYDRNGTEEKTRYAGLELILAKQLNYAKGIAGAYRNQGVAYINKYNDSGALAKYAEALSIYKSIDNKKDMADCYTRTAQVYHNSGRLVKALQYHLMAMKLLEETNDSSAIAYSYISIGLVYKFQRNYAEAQKNYERALITFQSNGDKKGLASAYNSIGDIYENQGIYPPALQNYFASIKALTAAGDEQHAAWPYYNIGEVCMYQNKFPEALKYYKIALHLHDALGDKSAVAWCYNNIGAVYYKQGNYKEAENYCLSALDKGKAINEITTMTNANKNLSLIYKAQGDYQKAMEYYETYITQRDSVYNNDNRLKIADQSTQREADLKDKQIKINQLTLDQKRNDRMLFGAGILLLMVTIAALYKNYKAQKKTNTVQQDMLQQKEMLMREIHHRVKNNLQVISTLLDLQLSNTKDTDAKDAITESTTRVKAISLIHQQLYQHEHVASIESAQFINELYTQVNAVFETEDRQVVFNNQVPQLVLDIDTAVPLGLIINELLTNSYKYAFASARGSITLNIEKQAESYKLTYRDSGPGLPAGTDTKKLKSLGMTLMKNLSRQIGGALAYEYETQTFVVTFKDNIGMKKTA